MNDVQSKLIESLVGVFKDAATKESAAMKEKSKEKEEESIKDVQVSKSKKEDESKDNANYVTADQFISGLTEMSNSIMKGVAELVKTPDQKAEEKKNVAVNTVKEYLTEKGFDLDGQSIDITFSEKKKGNAFKEGEGLELKLIKDGQDIVNQSNNSDDSNQFENVDAIPQDVKKKASDKMWRNMLKI